MNRFSTPVVKTIHYHFCAKIFHQISHVFRYLGQRDLRCFFLWVYFFAKINKYYCLILLSE